MPFLSQWPRQKVGLARILDFGKARFPIWQDLRNVHESEQRQSIAGTHSNQGSRIVFDITQKLKETTLFRIASDLATEDKPC